MSARPASSRCALPCSVRPTTSSATAGWRRIHRTWLVLLIVSATALRAADPTAAGIDFFERRIRPLFAENCFSCHGEEKQKGGLRLDSPAHIRTGGESGALLQPGNPTESRLLRAVGYQDKDLQMPPKQRLSERQVADLAEWVQLGAPLPAGSTAAVRPARKEFQISAEDRAYWAYQPVRRPALPPGPNAIDALVGEELRTHGLTANAPATPRELIRRVYFDLLGLPPSPEAVADFTADPSEERYNRLIEQLLALPQYGERWGRHWLDVVRFAQSNGYERDGEKLLAWRYRDYVIRAFNEDKPYDRFILEQLAGDELPDATADSVAATGFQRLGVFNDEPDDRLAAEFEALDDVLSTTGAAFLGLTVGCARCHDHKFDPLPQADYYGMLAFFRGLRPFESARSSFDSPGFAPLAPPRDVQLWQTNVQARIQPLREKLVQTTDAPEKKRLEKEIRQLQDNPPFEWTLAVREAGPNPPATHILIRGNTATPGAPVEPAFLRILGNEKPQLPAPAADAPSSGRRLTLARWIASPQNPLTARVMVNRLWQHHFGQGIVKTTTDFGRAGVPPTHPKLLDWLASEFVAGGWSMKHLHRLILRSATYQQSSRTGNPAALAADPGNRLLWRQNLRRLEAEAIRDTVLSVAGTLNRQMGGRGYFPHLGGEVLAGQSRPGLDWDVSTEAERNRRSVYSYVRRTMAIPLLENFDFNNTTSPQGERPTTTVAPQALMLLNDDFLHQQAAAMARRIRREAGDDTTRQIQRAYQLAVNRAPNPREQEIALGLWQRQTAAFAALSSRLSFRPDIASALATDYFDRLGTNEFLLGPTAGWNYHRGFWAAGYEGIRVVDRQRGPFALWPGARFTNGHLATRILFASSTEFASLLLRSHADADVAHGYEVCFDTRQQEIRLLRHEKNVRTLATATADLPAGIALPVRIELSGARIQVWLGTDPHPRLTAVDPEPLLESGLFGVRTWGGALSLEDLTLQPESVGTEHRIAVTPDPAPPTQRALESICLLLLNLNEVVYVD